LSVEDDPRQYSALSYIHAYIHAYMHTYIHAYMHTYIVKVIVPSHTQKQSECAIQRSIHIRVIN